MRKYILLFISVFCLCSCENRSRAVRPWEVSAPAEKKSEKKERGNDSIIENHQTEPGSAKSTINSSSYSSDNSSDSKYVDDGHPGTIPDDGLFGFDPYDDEDDAYDVERNQVDPYPDEW